MNAKNLLFYVALFFMGIGGAKAQELSAEDGTIVFHSHAILKDITEKNENLYCKVNTSNGEVYAEAKMNQFTFKEEMMQIVFRENYLHTKKHPNAILHAKITNLHEINFSDAGTYEAKLKGEMEVHGQKRPMECVGKITVGPKRIVNVNADFSIQLNTFGVEIPEHSTQDIANKIDISVDLAFYNQLYQTK